MDQSIKFSIIIPVYNVQEYLAQCIDSVMTQTYQNQEIILVDDGSTDCSGQICDQYSKKDPRIRVTHQRNGGLSNARNTGISQATGDYLMFLDSDDFWANTDVLLHISERLAASKADVLCLNYRKTDGTRYDAPYFGKQEPMPSQRTPSASAAFITEHHLWTACACNKVAASHLFRNNDLLFRTGITSEDIDWCVRLALCAQQLDYYHEPVICYRQRQDSISNATTAKKAMTLFANIQESLRLLDTFQDTEKKQLLEPYISYQYATLLVHIAKLEKPEERRAILKNVQEYQYLLKWSNLSKVRLMRLTSVIGSSGFTVLLLRILSKRKVF